MTEKKPIRLNTNQTKPKRGLLSPAELLRHADAIIRFDSETALKTQSNLSDLVHPSDDLRSANGGSPTSLEILCGSGGGLKIKSTEAPKNIVIFNSRKKD